MILRTRNQKMSGTHRRDTHQNLLTAFFVSQACDPRTGRKFLPTTMPTTMPAPVISEKKPKKTKKEVTIVE